MAADPEGDANSFALVSGAGDTDNASFTIAVNGQLRTTQPLDREAGTTRSVRVRVQDSAGNTFVEVFTITVTDDPEKPTDIALSDETVPDLSPAGTLVATISGTDPEGGALTFALVAGSGSRDNGSFTVQNDNELRTTDPILSFGSQPDGVFRIRLRDRPRRPHARGDVRHHRKYRRRKPDDRRRTVRRGAAEEPPPPRVMHHMRRLCPALVALALLLVAAPAAHADDPTIFTDENDGCAVGGCSLREAIDATAPGGTITLAAGTYTVSVAGTGEDANATGDLDANKSLTINGAGMEQTTIARTGSSVSVDGVFDVRAPLSVADLRVTGGNRTAAGGGAFRVGVGAAGDLSLAGVRLDDNRTNLDGGAIFVSSAVGGTRSTAVLTDAVVVGNRANNFGGGIFTRGDVELRRVAVDDNSAGDNGGGITVGGGGATVRGGLAAVNTTFAENSATFDGGAIANAGNIDLSFITVADNTAGRAAWGSSSSRAPRASAARSSTTTAAAPWSGS